MIPSLPTEWKYTGDVEKQGEKKPNSDELTRFFFFFLKTLGNFKQDKILFHLQHHSSSDEFEWHH